MPVGARTCLLGVVCLLAACHTQTRVQMPVGAALLPAPGEAAAHYDTQVPAGPGVLGEDASAIDEAVSNAAHEHGLEPVADPRLGALAAWTAAHATAEGQLPPEAAIDAAARHLGLVEPTPHFIGLTTNARAAVLDHLLRETRHAFAEHEYSHYGGSVRELGGQYLYVVALTWRWLTLVPVPRELALGTDVVLEGELTHGFGSPELAVTAPDGQVTRGAPAPSTHFALRVPTRLPGVYQVELLAQAKLGVEVVANFPVYVGVAAPSEIASPAYAPGKALTTAGDAAQASLELINHERQLARLRPLALDAPLCELARLHNLDMLEHGFLGHTSPITGTTVDRVTRAGIRSSLVLENIGRDSSVESVHAGLMNSPGHRGNILHPQATHVGIDVQTRGEGLGKIYLITQVFIRVSEPLPSDASALLLSSINQARAARGHAALHDDAGLRVIAERAAQRYFREPSLSDEQLMAGVRGELARTPSDHPRKLGALLAIAGGLDDVAALPALLDPAVRAISIGLSQGSRPDGFPNAICVVVLLAQ